MLVDLLTLTVFVAAGPIIVNTIENHVVNFSNNLVMLVLAYSLLSVGTYLLMELRPVDDDEDVRRNPRSPELTVMRGTSILFAFYMLAALYHMGHLSSGPLALNPTTPIQVFATVIAGVLLILWLGCYPLIFFAHFKASIPAGTARYEFARIAGLLCISLLVLITACYWDALMRGGSEGIKRSSDFVFFFPVFVFLTTVLSTSRLCLWVIEREKASLYFFVFTMAIYAWLSLNVGLLR
jgi:hypothetical protein